MSDENRDLERVERAVQMRVVGVADDVIAEAVGLTVEEFAQLVTNENFIALYEKTKDEKLKQAFATDDGWDSVEELAINSLKDILKYNKDPDLVLRAATMANKAQRRTSAGNRPIQNGHQPAGNNVVVLQLNKNFVVNMNARNEKAAQEIVGSAKRVDQLQPKDLDKMLEDHSTEDVDMGEVLGEIGNLAVPAYE